MRHTFTSSDAHALGLDLETQAPFVLPQRRRHPWFHPSRRDLASRIEALLRVALTARNGARWWWTGGNHC